MRQPREWQGAFRSVFLALGAIALFAFGGTAAFAQTTGKIIGSVTDQDTGQPLVGAQVVVEGTNLGNVSNQDGFYFINNVPVGVQTITAQYLGYQTTTQEQRVLAGQTMTVDFALSSEVVQAEGIVAVIEREPLVARDNTISKTRFTGEDARNLPVGNIESIVELGAGIYESGGGFVVRGGRVTESATFVDGVMITDFRNQLNTTEVSTFSVEEVDVITGGFNAEFGNAQSGIINIVTRDGGRDFRGTVRYTTDELEVDQSYGFNNLQASLSGPIIPDRLTFFVTGDITGAEDFFPASGGFNPAVGAPNSSGSTETILPNNRGDETRLQGKLTAFLPFAKVTGSYLFSRDQFENFQPSRSLAQQLSWTASRQKSHDVILGYDQQIFQTSEQSLNVQVRGNYAWRENRTGTPKSVAGAAMLDQVFSSCGAECDVTEDTFEEDLLNWRVDDIEFFLEDSTTNSLGESLTLFSNAPDSVFGVPGIWNQVGWSNVFFLSKERRYGLRVDVDGQINRVHRGKVGVEYTWVNFANNSQRFTDNIFADVYDVDPRIAAVYAQDRLDYGDLVIDLGLRWDYFDPNVQFPELPGVVDCSISPFRNADGSVNTTQCRSDVGVQEADTKSELSPRIGVAHPITDKTQVRLSFGKFYQLPQLRNFYSSYVTDINAAGGNNNITYGNPNLEHIETTAFEAGITHLLSENVVMDVVAYNRDRRGAVRLDVFQSGSIDETVDERRIFVNADNGNVKGFDITVAKRFDNYWSTDLAWSLQWARGTTASPQEFAAGSGFGRLFDPLNPGTLLTPPTELNPESFDRLHNINWQFALRFPDDFREGTAGGQILRNLGIFATYNAQSGNPFTRRSTVGQNRPLEDFGDSRMPWIHSGDIRVTKGFSLTDQVDLEVFSLITNFLDIGNVVNVNTTTGLPNRSGFEEQRSQSPTIPNSLRLPGDLESRSVFVEGVDRSPGDFPVQISDITPDFRGLLSKQDLDGNGTITFEESQQALFNALQASGFAGTFTGVNGDSVFNYGAPRQVQFGVQVQF